MFTVYTYFALAAKPYGDVWWWVNLRCCAGGMEERRLVLFIKDQSSIDSGPSSLRVSSSVKAAHDYPGTVIPADMFAGLRWYTHTPRRQSTWLSHARRLLAAVGWCRLDLRHQVTGRRVRWDIWPLTPVRSIGRDLDNAGRNRRQIRHRACQAVGQ